MLALGLVGCPDDENEKDDAKYSLKVAKPSSAKVGEAFSVEVKLYKGDALVKDDDAKGAKDADVTGSIKCKEHSAKVDLTKAKLSDAGKANLSVTIEDNSDKTAAAPGTKGYTDCVVSASTEFGDDKTKASGSSEKFGVAAKTASDDPGDGDKPEFPATVIDGKEFSIKNGKGAEISLIKKNTTVVCDVDNNFFFKVSDTSVTEIIALNHAIVADADTFVVIGNACDLKIKDVDGVRTINAAGSDDNPRITSVQDAAGDTNDKIGVTLPGVTSTETKSVFVSKKGITTWSKVDIPTDYDWATGGAIASTVEAHADDDGNRVLVNIGEKWSHDKG